MRAERLSSRHADRLGCQRPLKRSSQRQAWRCKQHIQVRGRSRLSRGQVELLLEDAVLHTRVVVRTQRDQAVEHAIAAAKNSATIRRPRKAYAWLKHPVVRVDDLRRRNTDRAGLAVRAGQEGP